MSKEVIRLAEKLYFDLPFWKRWQANKYYKTNNWDVTGAWKQCVNQSRKMIEDSNFYLK